MSPVAWLYMAVLATLVPFGSHRILLLWRRLILPARDRRTEWPGDLPPVTVQLPVYNEANVIERLVDAVCRLDYPRELLEVQVLDDSDDETPEIARRVVERWRRRGVRVQHVRRGSRHGFKAGALQYGVDHALGDFLLVLDADFVPPASLVRDLLPSFADPGVGAVQAAWSHLNLDYGWLTRAQAMLLDAHFAIEHEARHRAGLFFNFNGTAGMWRRACVESVGGWQADTLTEDLDLSYRVQLAGWELAYHDEIRVPGELPERLSAVETQQERWAQGGVQTARKLLGGLWRADLPQRVKWEATAHLMGNVVHPLTLVLGVALAGFGLLAPAEPGLPGWIHGFAFGLATVPFALFYGVAARLRGCRWRRIPRRVGEAMLLGLALGVPLTWAVARGLSGASTAFFRTPKRGFAPVRTYVAALNRPAGLLRASLSVVLVAAVVKLLIGGLPAAAPFTGLFAAAYLLGTRETFRESDPLTASAPDGLAGIGAHKALKAPH